MDRLSRGLTGALRRAVSPGGINSGGRSRSVRGASVGAAYLGHQFGRVSAREAVSRRAARGTSSSSPRPVPLRLGSRSESEPGYFSPSAGDECPFDLLEILPGDLRALEVFFENSAGGLSRHNRDTPEFRPARDDTEAIDANVAVAAVAEDLAPRRSFVLSHFARFTSRGSPAGCDGAGDGASSSRARPSSTARL